MCRFVPGEAQTDPVFPRFQTGNDTPVEIRKIVERRFRYQGRGVNAVGDISAVISANVGTGSSHSFASTESRQRIVQRSGRPHVSEQPKTTQEGSQDHAVGGGSNQD
jgi:hypothetical protein